MIRPTTALALVLLLAACVPAPVRGPGDASLLAAQAAHEAALQAEPDWRLEGRLAVRAGGEGGSGRLEWRQQGGGYEIRLSAPVTGKGWRLLGSPDGARIEGLDAGPVAGPDARALLAEATGWDIPVDDLAWWVRGGRAPGAAEIEFGADGRPARLVQQGWTVEYREWVGERPRRVFASRGEASVRLVVDSWGQP